MILLYETKMAGTRAEVEALPGPTRFKGVLRRCVQLFKRHRDVFFAARALELAPISIIPTHHPGRPKLRPLRDPEPIRDRARPPRGRTAQHPHGIRRARPPRRPRAVLRLERDDPGRELRREVATRAAARWSFLLWQAASSLRFQTPLTAAGLDEVRNQLSGWLGKDVTGKALSPPSVRSHRQAHRRPVDGDTGHRSHRRPNRNPP